MLLPGLDGGSSNDALDQEERKGQAKEELDNAQERIERKADEVADLERRT